MVARIDTSAALSKSIGYNEEKVQQGIAERIYAGNFLKDADQLNFQEIRQQFLHRNELNANSETNTFHAKLSFHPSEQLSNEKMTRIAERYMEGLEMDEQPFIVYRHHDTDVPHLHIISTLIKEDGDRIRTQNMAIEKSNPARQAIEKEFGLIPAGTPTQNLGPDQQPNNHLDQQQQAPTNQLPTTRSGQPLSNDNDQQASTQIAQHQDGRPSQQPGSPTNQQPASGTDQHPNSHINQQPDTHTSQLPNTPPNQQPDTKTNQHQPLLQKIKHGEQPTLEAIQKVVVPVVNNYNYTSLEELNAILRQYNVKADPGHPDSNTYKHQGLHYRLLDEDGNGIGTPIKASSLHTKPTLRFLENKYEQNRLDRDHLLTALQNKLDQTLRQSPDHLDTFIQTLEKQDIRVVASRHNPVTGHTTNLPSQQEKPSTNQPAITQSEHSDLPSNQSLLNQPNHNDTSTSQTVSHQPAQGNQITNQQIPLPGLDAPAAPQPTIELTYVDHAAKIAVIAHTLGEQYNTVALFTRFGQQENAIRPKQSINPEQSFPEEAPAEEKKQQQRQRGPRR